MFKQKIIKIVSFEFKFFFPISTNFAALIFDSFDNIMINAISFRVLKRFDFFFDFFRKTTYF